MAGVYILVHFVRTGIVGRGWVTPKGDDGLFHTSSRIEEAAEFNHAAALSITTWWLKKGMITTYQVVPVNSARLPDNIKQLLKLE